MLFSSLCMMLSQWMQVAELLPKLAAWTSKIHNAWVRRPLNDAFSPQKREADTICKALMLAVGCRLTV